VVVEAVVVIVVVVAVVVVAVVVAVVVVAVVVVVLVYSQLSSLLCLHSVVHLFVDLLCFVFSLSGWAGRTIGRGGETKEEAAAVNNSAPYVYCYRLCTQGGRVLGR